jgi:hypothetical protein
MMVALCAMIPACGNESTPTTPSSGYEGQWSGTTSQGKSIAFTVSSDQKVTSITVGYGFGTCSGEHRFANLSLEIGVPPIPPRGTPRGPTPTPGPGFGYGSGPPDAPNFTQITGWFTSSTTASGIVIFGEYPGCGNAVGIWSADRR